MRVSRPRRAGGSRARGSRSTKEIPHSIRVLARTRFMRTLLVSWEERNTDGGTGRKLTPARSGEYPCDVLEELSEEEEHPVHPGVHETRGRRWLSSGWGWPAGASGRIGSSTRDSLCTNTPSRSSPGRERAHGDGTRSSRWCPPRPARARCRSCRAVEVIAPAMSKRPWRRSVSLSTDPSRHEHRERRWARSRTSPTATTRTR